MNKEELDNNNLKIHYEIKPSFTTRKLKQLQQENKQLKDNWNKLKEFLKQENYKNEDFWCINSVEVLDKMQELEKGSEE